MVITETLSHMTCRRPKIIGILAPPDFEVITAGDLCQVQHEN